MSPEPNSPLTQRGAVDGVYTWPISVFEDLRGRLFKAYVAGPVASFPIAFDTYEHFFTESHKDVFRGMHFQGDPHAASKVISLVRGRALVYLLDARPDSATHANVQVENFDVKAPISIYVPKGVALGYLILEDDTTISYRMDAGFCGNCDGGISASVVADYLPIPIEKTIRSERDLKLDSFEGFVYKSQCP